ncbi:MAG: amino acid adenylation domain-containing protein [Betaproteobacteria bacterium]|nr:amino acid adenylation domain-containing protein [Betaproteobacteria bacterium]
MSFNPAQPVFEQCLRTPDRLALYAGGVELTYAELRTRAARLAHALQARGMGRGERIGILGSRSLTAMLAVLGAAWAGATYVPLGVRWPQPRLQSVLPRVALDGLIVDETGLALLTPSLLDAIPLLVVPSDAAWRGLPPALQSKAISLEALTEYDGNVAPTPLQAGDLAYIVFTSGTTGVPKGVMVPCAALGAYLAALAARKAMTPQDRASQFTELTFDPSVGEIFVPWRAGASLHVVPPVSQVSPAKFIRERSLTVWGSTPALIAWMRATRSLQPGSLPSLRYTSFGGEPLPLASVQAWQAAAPNSVVDNLYGPTEATVDCAGQRLEPGATAVATPERGIAAIGVPHPGTELAVMSPDLRRAALGERGELAIAGAQLSAGYLGAPELTAERFRWIEGKRWYLTGDLALQDASGMFHVLGRGDNQIKFLGHRVELEDIEAHVRAIARTDQVAALAWPIEDGVAQAIVCFVAGSALEPTAIRRALRERVPAHMVPSTIHSAASLPLTGSGKLDRHALAERLAVDAEGKSGEAAAVENADVRC